MSLRPSTLSLIHQKLIPAVCAPEQKIYSRCLGFLNFKFLFFCLVAQFDTGLDFVLAQGRLGGGDVLHHVWIVVGVEHRRSSHQGACLLLIYFLKDECSFVFVGQLCARDTFCQLGVGEFFGELALLEPDTRSSTVRAQHTSTLRVAITATATIISSCIIVMPTPVAY